MARLIMLCLLRSCPGSPFRVHHPMRRGRASYSRIRAAVRSVPSSQWASKQLRSQSAPGMRWLSNTGESFSSAYSTATSKSKLVDSIYHSLTENVVKETDLEDAKNQNLIVVLSVSGGSDSMAMLHACMELRSNLLESETDFPFMHFHVVHFHHRQRNEDADLDCQLVKDVAEEYELPFKLQDWNDELSFSSDSFSQDLARKWRRQRLVEYTEHLLVASNLSNRADGKSIGVILTAHHENDSTETMVLKLLRGVHLLNLSGMETITRIGSAAENQVLFLVRPWLQYTKQDLKDYLLSRGKKWREDSSNASPKYLRNRVRNELVPLLEELSPNIHRRLEVLEQQSQEVNSEIQSLVQTYLEDISAGEDGFPWIDDEPHPLIQSQALYQWINTEMERIQKKDEKVDPTGVVFISYDTLQRAERQLRDHRNQMEWTIELGGHFNLRRQGTMLKVDHSQASASSWKVVPWSWSIVPSPSIEEAGATPDSLTIALPQDLVSSSLKVMKTTVGNYRLLLDQPDEDVGALRFMPPWKKEGKPVKLRQFLRGQSVPIHERDQVPVLCISWSEGMKETRNELLAVQIRDSWFVQRRFAFMPAGEDDKKLLLQIEQREQKD
eukprot:scaffold921_cov126-Cylindrotheca_fusiformis.AAC.1